uniref:B30.2/SPRY domain-containing protein n=1 Tax=Globodera rostochiensis TaxID=31243 RepID=A0A914HWI9_GLORO
METPRRDQINRGLAVFESPGHDLLLFLRYKIIQFLLWRIAAAGASNKNDSHIKRRRRLPLELQCEVFSTLPFQYGRRILLLCRPIAINCVALVRKLKERLKNGWDPTACHEYLTLIESGQLGVQHFPSCYSVYAKRPIPKNGIFYYEVNIIVVTPLDLQQKQCPSPTSHHPKAAPTRSGATALMPFIGVTRQRAACPQIVVVLRLMPATSSDVASIWQRAKCFTRQS